MTDKLPPNLLALFAPRPALRYLPPSDHAQEDRHTNNISGVGQYLQAFKEYEDEYVPSESWLQKRDRARLEKKEAHTKLITEGFKGDYKPSDDSQIKGDAFKTLFISRLSYDTETKDLEREFGRFGPIERIRIVTNAQAEEKASKKKRNRGYAFVVYEREKDMKAAYKETDGMRIKDRRVVVDVERGRTVSGWRPRRFGGGLGGRGYTRALASRPVPGGFGGPPPGSGFRGGFRGGFDRGGFDGGRGGFRGGRGGGFGDRGGRGGFGGGRGGIGYQSNGFGSGAPPEGAPSGPRGGRGGGFGPSGGFGDGGRSRGYDVGSSNGGGGYGGRGYDDRGASGSNAEPVRPRDRGDRGDRSEPLRERDRDRDREKERSSYRERDGGYPRDDYSRKRDYGGDSYDDRSSKRRY